MTRIFKSILVLVVALMLTLTLTGCGFASKAEKLVENFKAGEELTLAIVQEEMGDATADYTVTAFGMTSGAVVWVAGCKTMDEVEAKWEEGKSVDALVVTILANKIATIEFVQDFSQEDLEESK